MKNSKIGDKVIFIDRLNHDYSWKLVKGETYIIYNVAFNTENPKKWFYGVKYINSNRTQCWYNIEDFLTLKEYRKEKLRQIKNA